MHIPEKAIDKMRLECLKKLKPKIGFRRLGPDQAHYQLLERLSNLFCCKSLLKNQLRNANGNSPALFGAFSSVELVSNLIKRRVLKC